MFYITYSLTAKQWLMMNSSGNFTDTSMYSLKTVDADYFSCKLPRL